MVREVVVSPRVMEVLATDTLQMPRVIVVRLQKIAYLPQEKTYLVLKITNLPLVKEVLLEENVVCHSLLESFFDCFDALGVPGLLSI